MRTNGSQLLPVDAVTRCLAIWPVINQSRLHENFEMLRDSRLGKVEPAHDILAATGILEDQLPENVDTHRMPQRCIYARCGIVIYTRHHNIGHHLYGNIHRKSTIYDYTQKGKIPKRPF